MSAQSGGGRWQDKINEVKVGYLLSGIKLVLHDDTQY